MTSRNPGLFAQSFSRASEATSSLRVKINLPPKNWEKTPGDVRDQGTCLSCTSYALATMLETCRKVRDHDPNIELAAAWMHKRLAFRECREAYDLWALVEDVRRASNLLPYQSESGAEPPFDVNVPRKFPVPTLRELEQPQDVRDSLLNAGPVVVTMLGDTPFFDNWDGRKDVYRYTGQGKSGHHAICLVGFDDGQRCWIAKNSFGTTWGVQGYGLIDYDTCEIGNINGFGLA